MRYELNELRDIAVYSANKAGYPEIAEDFAQEALMLLSQGRKATMSQLLIDYLRAEFGSTRDGRETQGKWYERKAYHEIDPNRTEDAVVVKTDTDFYKLIDTLDKEERAMTVLFHKWGLSLLEIGDCFGVSESRISQELSRIHIKIKRHATRTHVPERVTSKE